LDGQTKVWIAPLPRRQEVEALEARARELRAANAHAPDGRWPPLTSPRNPPSWGGGVLAAHLGPCVVV